MGRCQTETSYLKSVVLWLQEYWTGPAVLSVRLERCRKDRGLFCAQDACCIKSARRVVDLPAFLPPRNVSEYRQRKAVNQGR